MWNEDGEAVESQSRLTRDDDDSDVNGSCQPPKHLLSDDDESSQQHPDSCDDRDVVAVRDILMSDDLLAPDGVLGEDHAVLTCDSGRLDMVESIDGADRPVECSEGLVVGNENSVTVEPGRYHEAAIDSTGSVESHRPSEIPSEDAGSDTVDGCRDSSHFYRLADSTQPAAETADDIPVHDAAVMRCSEYKTLVTQLKSAISSASSGNTVLSLSLSVQGVYNSRKSTGILKPSWKSP